MDILSRQFGHAIVVSLSGSVDALTAPEVTNYLTRQVAAEQRQLVLDLAGVDFMSSAGLRAILGALKESRQEGGDLRLAGAQPGVEKVLKMSGFTNILKAFPSVEEAVGSYSQ
jgi:anti-sigma B factor antagonist